MRTVRKIGDRRLWLLLLCAWVQSAAPVPAHADEVYRADRVKAAFLYRFAAYVNWPAEALSEPVFVLAVLEDDAVAAELAAILPDRPIKNLPSRVQAIHGIEEAADALMLYVGPSYSGDLRALIDALGTRPVLVVTDREQALDDGSTINFRQVDQRLRFEVSLPAAYRAGLKVEPALLTVAAQVRSGPRSELACAVPPGIDSLCLLLAAR